MAVYSRLNSQTKINHPLLVGTDPRSAVSCKSSIAPPYRNHSNMTEPHTEGQHWVAQEGPYSAATSDVAVLHYFPARGRAEPIRLAMALVGQPWFEPPIEPLAAVMRRQLDSYPFRQLPRYVEEGDVDLVQSMAILRHLGRKHKLYGSDLAEAASIDMVLEAAADLRAKLKNVWCTTGFSPQAVAAYTSTVLAPAEQLCSSDEPGPGLACLERLLSGRHRDWPASCEEPPGGAAEAVRAGVAPGSSGMGSGDLGDAADVVGDTRHGAGDEEDDAGKLWLVGDKISIADIVVADLVDMHLEASQLETSVRHNFPHLVLLRRRVLGQPGVKKYLGSSNRHSLVWGQDWQPARDNKDANKMVT